MNHTCALIEDQERSPGCLGTFDADEPDIFVGFVVCPPCYESIKAVIAEAKTKGVHVEVEYQ